MPKGGKREGAGRKKGSTGKRREGLIDAIKETGQTPLEYFTSVFQNELKPEPIRLDAAKAAAPFLHPRLSSVEMNANVSMTHEDALSELDDD